MTDPELDRFLAEAEAHPVAGWDFGWLGARMRSSDLPWSFEDVVVRHARASPDLLDLGTGGGEWLASLPHRPPRTVAAEGWEPNVAVARERLTPLGVEVVPVEPAPDNVDQNEGETRGRLPFPDASFQLVVCRHESFVADEIRRVLAAPGRFVTQQLGSSRYDELRRDLGLPPAGRREWALPLAVAQLESAGLRVGDSAESAVVTSFADVGALAWFLRAAPWTVPEFSIAEHREALAAVHRRIAAEGPYELRGRSFWLEAVRDPVRGAAG